MASLYFFTEKISYKWNKAVFIDKADLLVLHPAVTLVKVADEQIILSLFITPLLASFFLKKKIWNMISP